MNEYILQVVTGFLGAAGFAFLYNIRGRRLLFAALGGLLSWLFYLVAYHFWPNDILCYFISATLVAIYAEVMARVIKTPTTTFITISLIPLVPGGSLYYTMTYAFRGEAQNFIEKGVHTLGLAGALAAGVILVAGMTSAFHRIHTHFKKEN